MSTLIWDIAQSLKDVGCELNNFLYDGKIKNGQLKDHTKEELILNLSRFYKIVLSNMMKFPIVLDGNE